MFKIQIDYYQNLFREYPDIVSVRDLMKMLSVGKTFAYELLAKNEIKKLNIGRHIKITKREIIDYIIKKELDCEVNDENKKQI